MDTCLVYVTAPHRDEARDIARALVEQRLAAFVNILDGMTSVYRWDGAVHQDAEVLLLIKTCSSKTSALIESIKKIHSYSCPCITVLPILDGNPDFLAWIRAETDPA